MSATTYATQDTHQDESIFQTSANAVSDAALDARASAKAAAQSVKNGLGRGAYKAAFGVSFGVVFTGVFLTELLPVSSSVRRGLEDGAGAALDAIEARKQPLEDSGYTEPDIEPSEAAPSPLSSSISAAAVHRAPRKRRA